MSPSYAKRAAMTHRVAIVGAGPSGFYAADGLLRANPDLHIDVIDRLPTPFGLVRAGVAPDHQGTKAVVRQFDRLLAQPDLRFAGNIEIGRDLSWDELSAAYDAVIVATGMVIDKKLGVPGEDLPHVWGSWRLVGWLNGHPDYRQGPDLSQVKSVAVIGNGNVALDCARILSKTSHEFEGSDIVGHALEALEKAGTRTITILGRRGPHQIAMTPKELGELGHLEAASPTVDAADFPPLEADETLEPGHRKSITILRDFAATLPDPAKPKRMVFDFFAKPVAIEGDGKAERIVVERTRLDEEGRAVGTGETYVVPAGLIVSCIGYSTSPIPGVPYDEKHGHFLNDHGQINDQIYCVGWARRGPTGTIGTNRPDGYEVAEQVASAMPADSGGGKKGGEGLNALLVDRGVEATSFDDWRTIEKAEEAQARTGSPREKMVRVDEWLKVLGR